MFIVYQIRSKLSKTIVVPHIECPNCKQKGQLQMHFFQKYTWLFGPILPAGKSAVLDCTTCQSNITTKNWTKELHFFLKTQKKQIPIPFRYYSGFVFFSPTAFFPRLL